MPAKTIHPIGDQSGGVNTFANERDADDRQYTVGYNVDSSIPGEIRCVGAWSSFFSDGNAVVDGISDITFSPSGLNDMSIKSTIGSYTGGVGSVDYKVICHDSSESPDTFKWQKDTGSGYGSESEAIDMTEGPDAVVELDNGVKVTWAAVEGHTNASSWVFTVSVSAFQDTKAGYGIFPFQTDFDHTGTVFEGHYLAVAKPDANNLKISMYHQPQVGGVYVSKDVIEIGTVHADTCADFIWVDGALRIFDASLTGNDHKFYPKKWWLQESGNKYFKGTQLHDLEISTNTWQTTRQQLVSPTGGKSYFTGFDEPFKIDEIWSESGGLTAEEVMHQDLDILATSSNVGLLIMGHEESQDDTTNWDEDYVGWGKDATTAAEYYFYYSYLYENSQESLLFRYPGKRTLGGGVFGADHNTGKKVTFIPVTNPGTDASEWDRRITGIRLYYRRAEEESDVKYFIGEFPITSLTNDGDNVSDYLDDFDLTPVLLGDESGNPFGLGDYKDVGIFHATPPTIFTHATMSGIRNSTKSIACKYKTATIINRRLYVGNIKQKTAESNGIEKKYPDRIIKSLPNKFDTLPDTEFIDVAIRDGEEIIKLESLGSRLLQFKQNTLYTIAVAGGEEYLDGTYKNMGVLHPHAVTKTDFGIFWVNDKGAYLYTGESAPVNLIDGKISLKEWRDWITKDAITGYIPKEKKLIVINNSADVWSNPEVAGTVDMYIFNVLTQSWNQGVNAIGTADTNLNAVSNIVNYVDSNKETNTILFVGNSNLYEYKTVDDIANNSRAKRVFNLTTKDIHAGAAHVRKKFYKAYITYKGLGLDDGTAPANTAIPTVKAIITGADGKSTVTLVGGTTFAVPGNGIADDWRTAEYKIDNTSTSDKAASRNAYSVKLVISGDTVYQNFKINDISLVFRPKSVK